MTLSLVLVSIAIALLLIYAADLAISMNIKDSLLSINSIQRGLILGVPALVLPFIAIFASSKSDKTVPTLVLVTGILIIIGGITMSAKYIQDQANSQQEPQTDLKIAEENSYNPVLFEIGTLFSVGGFQILLGFKKMQQSRRES